MPVVIGSGGHAKVVIDAMLASGIAYSAIRVRDANPARAGAEVLGVSVAVPDIDETLAGDVLHIAIGHNDTRARLHAAALALPASLAVLKHPASTVAQNAQIGDGSFVAARATVGPDATIGCSVIINHGAVVDHDCTVGDFSHIAPNATLGGGVSVGARTLIGSGAVVLPGVKIGDNVTVGAGAVVLRDIGDGERWAGNPATRLIG